MKWFLVILFTGSATVEPMPGKLECEELRSVVQAVYGKASALVDVRCVAINDNGRNGK